MQTVVGKHRYWNRELGQGFELPPYPEWPYGQRIATAQYSKDQDSHKEIYDSSAMVIAICSLPYR
jgi:hypothetical protein